jgi:WbqC-like protein
LIAVILQPSYIPWRGYFDQIRRADTFVFYDDVQYDKHGWRNRNQIKTSNGKAWLTIPVHSSGVTGGIPIKDVRIDWSKPWAESHLKSLASAYARAPYFKKYQPMLEGMFARRDTNISDFDIEFTRQVARELGLVNTRFLRASELPGITGQKTARLIQILQQIGATHYVSGPSARDYIEQAQFEQAGIALEYMTYDYPEYPQLHPPYDPFVSVLDLLFMMGDKSMDYIKGKEMLTHGSH